MKRKIAVILAIYIFHMATSVAYSQSASSTNSNQSNTSISTQSESNVSLEDNKNLREGIKTLAEGSRTQIGWGLAIIAASIAAIVSTSYFRPVSKKVRLIYLFFIPGWVFISLSIYYGDKVSRRYIAATLVTKYEIIRAIGNNMNSEFSYQLFYLQLGLLCFSVWLALFLLWWVFGEWSVPTNETKTGGTQ